MSLVRGFHCIYSFLSQVINHPAQWNVMNTFTVTTAYADQIVLCSEPTQRNMLCSLMDSLLHLDALDCSAALQCWSFSVFDARNCENFNNKIVACPLQLQILINTGDMRQLTFIPIGYCHNLYEYIWALITQIRRCFRLDATGARLSLSTYKTPSNLICYLASPCAHKSHTSIPKWTLTFQTIRTDAVTNTCV